MSVQTIANEYREKVEFARKNGFKDSDILGELRKERVTILKDTKPFHADKMDRITAVNLWQNSIDAIDVVIQELEGGTK